MIRTRKFSLNSRYLHHDVQGEPVIHRDLKPGNVMLAAELEAKVAELDAKVEGLSANRRPERKPSTGADPAKENAADVLAAEIQTALNSAEMVVAKKKMERKAKSKEGSKRVSKG